MIENHTNVCPKCRTQHPPETIYCVCGEKLKPYLYDIIRKYCDPEIKRILDPWEA